MKKPFPWYGGKDALAPLLVSLLPPHDTYVEVFGGSAALLFAKKPGKIEIYNDIDSGLVNFFRVLRDREQVQELQRLLSLTPYSREEYYDCLHTWQDAGDPIEMARRWYTVILLSFSNNVQKAGWSYSQERNPAKDYRSGISRLMGVVDRLSLVQIDHRPFTDVIPAYDSPDTCFYLDPPYLPETRLGHGYLHEMSRQDHEQLLEVIRRVKGMVILSGYSSPLYHEALIGWECITRSVECSSVGRTRKSGLQGSGVILHQHMRTECIWRNAAAVDRSQSLWNTDQQNSTSGSEAMAAS